MELGEDSGGGRVGDSRGVGLAGEVGLDVG